MPTVRSALLVFATLAVAACGDNAAGPNFFTRVLVLEGGGASDTVHAFGATSLVVEVTDMSGHPEAGVRVVFDALPHDPTGSQRAARGISVCWPCATYTGEADYYGMPTVTEVTDSTGQASVRVVFGTIAGPASIEVSVPDSDAHIVVPYLTRPGNLQRVIAAAPDTAVYVGATYDLGARSADQFGNPRTDAVTLSTVTPSVISLASGHVTATALGRGRIVMRAGHITDTAFVSVPPRGRLGAFGWAANRASINQLTLANTDGSNRVVITTTQSNDGTGAPAWTPDGSALVIQNAQNAGGQLSVIDTLGHQRRFLADSGAFSGSLQAAFSAASSDLFFYGTLSSTGVDGIYRANAAGQGATFLFSGAQPAPSPDGSRIAYVSGASLMVRDMVSGQTTLLAPYPELPRWSPVGNLIAFVGYDGPSDVRVVQFDGGGLRTIAPGDHDPGIAWSPDGAWLVAAHSGGGLELIRVADGERLPIPSTRDLTLPAWHP